MIMKKRSLITIVMLSAALTACGPKKVSTPVTEAETAVEVVETTAAEEEEIPAVEIENEAKPAATEKSKTNNIAESQAGGKTEGVYEDNFAVGNSDVMAFANKIKAAVAAKDIEALADLTAFPVYVGIAEDGVETREAFITLGAEKIFAPNLVESVAGADISNLSPSMAGFSISKDGKSNIIFGVVGGRLAISGINYE